MMFLRQSTASQSRSLGPFLDDTDFKTAETGLTIANTDIKLLANGAASANKNSGGGTHRANGVYGVTFDATDTATVGELFVSVVVAGALPVFHTFMVVEEAVYDQFYAAAAPSVVALDATGTRAALGMAAADLDTQLTAITAQTDLLPADPAGVSDLPDLTALVAALLDDEDVETGLSVRNALRLTVAALSGKLSGAATTTVTIRNFGDTKNRIVANVDTVGNRSSVTTDLTD